EQAIGLAERAVELDPYNSETHAALGQFNAAAGHVDRAADEFRKAAELGAVWIHMLAANLELVRGNQPEAARQLLLSEPVAMITTVPQWPAHTAYTYARLNLDEDATRFLARFDELATEQHVPAAADILSHLARGKEEKALQRLEEAAAEKAPYEAFNLLMSIVANTFKDPVLDKPVFAEARHKLEFAGLSRPPPPPPHAEPEHRGRHPGPPHAESEHRGGHPGPPPPQAIEACAGLSEGDTCGFSAPMGHAEGSCIIPPEFKTILVCAPAGGPRPERARPD
ncbi:MAG: tetratricopeptide repeat protein, partial [Thiogranum sp.]